MKEITYDELDYILTTTLGLNTASMRDLKHPSLVKTIITLNGYKILILEIADQDNWKAEEEIRNRIKKYLVPVITSADYGYLDLVLRYR